MKRRIFMLLMAMVMMLGMTQTVLAETEVYEGYCTYRVFDYGEPYYPWLVDEDGYLIIGEDGYPVESDIPEYAIDPRTSYQVSGTANAVRNLDAYGYSFSGESEYEDGSRAIWSFDANTLVSSDYYEIYDGIGSVTYYGNEGTISGNVTCRIYVSEYGYDLQMQTEMVDGKSSLISPYFEN